MISAGCSKQTTTTNNADSNSVNAPTTQATKTFSMADVAAANGELKCYSVIRGMVYDLTPFISKHPGGKANILKICGKDGSSYFEKQHGGKEKPENALKGFEIGKLAS